MKKSYSAVFILGLVALVMVWGVAVIAIVNLRDSLKYEYTSIAIFDSADNLHDLLIDSIANQQKFLTTNDNDYFSKYKEDLIEIPKSIDQLKKV